MLRPGALRPVRRESGVRAFAKQTSNLPGFISGRLVRSKGPPPGAERQAGIEGAGE